MLQEKNVRRRDLSRSSWSAGRSSRAIRFSRSFRPLLEQLAPEICSLFGGSEAGSEGSGTTPATARDTESGVPDDRRALRAFVPGGKTHKEELDSLHGAYAYTTTIPHAVWTGEMSTYDDLLKVRSDMTSWLIHFVRQQDIAEPAIDVLKKIIASGVVEARWAERGGKRQVFGPRPAVCFTEQPLSSFIGYVRERKNLFRVAPYGVVIHKKDVYALGGLPVIYDLSDANREVDPTSLGLPADTRVLDPAALPLNEQYRFVAFNPNRLDQFGGPIDWTHEREWRWAPDDQMLEMCTNEHKPPGLLLKGGWWIRGNKGACCYRIHFLVASDLEAGQLQHFISTLSPPQGWYFVAQSGGCKVISLESAARDSKWKVEDWV